MRVALASSGGEFVDMHFGLAVAFEVYDVSAEGCEFVDRRSAFDGGACNEDEFGRVAEVLADCKVLFVARIGPPAVQFLAGRGFRVFEAPFPVEAVLEAFRKQEFATAFPGKTDTSRS